ncbi:MAG TPA: glycosyltransferase family 4 protein [Actinophytocola sp.]|uniref:glycosyltransferase family 4 protein n=1 Tax=Actinophytocola sp. TaxID=1872138 RepID=UPI002DDD9F4D|nr:glycosyltransferase family 4 protein [Actinophytocola sp.]HEV2781643.1 glycosyltransferase family 4 protein [Actinophytocola sp.]
MSSRPHVLLLNWRDTAHPEGGGSERYLERMAEGLVGRGYRVTIQCAAYQGAAADEWRGGVRFRRRGNRFTVYPRALLAVAGLRPDVIVDVQNGIPFFSRLVARCPVLVLVHHVHREQWRSVLGDTLGRLGWWIESRLAPWLYRGCRYLTVSEVTRDELATLGIRPERVTVIRPGLDPPPRTSAEPDEDPTLVVVGRLVPHKRIEHAIDALARLSERWPKLRLEVVGQGWWRPNLLRHAELRGVEDRVTLHGWVDERDKHEILARSAVHLCPSVKEGWGIAIMEAAAHGVPSVAYRAAGGVCESIVDNKTGVLAEDFEAMVHHIDHLLRWPAYREALGRAGRDRAAGYGWERGVDLFERALTDARSRPRRPRGRAAGRRRS